MNNYKLIICDVDGTLAESRQEIDEEMSSLISEVLETKIFCAISGGSEKLLFKQLGPLIEGEDRKENLLISATSGSVLLFYYNNIFQAAYRDTLTYEEKKKIIRIICNLEEEYILKCSDTDDTVEFRGSQITLSCCGHNASLEIKKKFDPDGKKRLEMLEWIRNHKKLDTTGLAIRIGGNTSIDFTREGIDKRYGVMRVLKHLYNSQTPIHKEEVVFFGDKTEKNGNDYIENYVRTIQIDSISQMKAYLRKIIIGESF